MVSGAPVWAQAGTDPSSPIGVSPKEYGRFAAAAAARYDGSFGDLPRIQIWQAWNEPNITTFLRPQLVRGRPVAAHNYRALVNALATNVKRIHKDNLVVAGGLAPFRDSTQEIVDQDEDWGPLSFMREVLCLSDRLRAKCDARVRFDVWAMHPTPQVVRLIMRFCQTMCRWGISQKYEQPYERPRGRGTSSESRRPVFG